MTKADFLRTIGRDKMLEMYESCGVKIGTHSDMVVAKKLDGTARLIAR